MTQLSQTLDHLPDNKIQELETINQRIIKTGKVEMILLFVSYARGTWRE